MLEVIGADMENSNATRIDFVARFKASELYHCLQRTINQEGITGPSEGLSPLPFDHKRAATNSSKPSERLSPLTFDHKRAATS
ncbi:unnamed protein product [Phytophthora lilii]|uniref:Unnamed protein product n=1 Tax=Phytophthora lilii TaxID=2077276 RepID=A0A9W6TDR1_9STRA|nr:unnamed protein product [Phytophthora lilii]